MKKWITYLLLLCMMATTCGCGAGKAKPLFSLKEAKKAYEKVIGKEGKQAEGTELLQEGINTFALEMYNRLSTEENIFFSPYSLCSALSLLDVSAGGETKAELEAMLGIADLDTWNQEMLSYMNKQWTKDTFVLTANSVWLQQGRTWSENMEEGFIQPAAYFYNSETYEVDFLGNYEQTIKSMNKWASDNTNGMIKNIADQTPKDTVFALMNAVYFEGKWSRPFLANYTREATFHAKSGDVLVEMMNEYDSSYRYIEKYGIKGVSLPYKDSSIVMKIFIPTEEYSETSKEIDELFAALSVEKQMQLISALDDAKYESIKRLSMPKYELEQSIDGLVDILMDMGMESAFEGSADFDTISEDLFVSMVAHKAKIIVDEEGTKAAAVTEIATCETCAMDPEEPKYFIADRPFLYVIQDMDSGIILFMGLTTELE